MTRDEKVETLQAQLKTLRYAAAAGWSMVLIGAVAAIAMGARANQKTAGLIARVKTLEDNVNKLMGHVHVAKDGETTIVADRIYIPRKRGANHNTYQGQKAGEFGAEYQNGKLHRVGLVLYEWQNPWDWRGQFVVVREAGLLNGKPFKDVVRIMIEDNANNRQQLWERAISRDGGYYEVPRKKK